MKRVIKNILIILLIIIVLIVIDSIRKYTILTSLYDKAEQYVGSANYKHRVTNTVSNNYTKSVIYVLGDRFKFEKTKVEGDTIISSDTFFYKNEDGTYTANEYTQENGINKTAKVNMPIQASVNITNPLMHENRWQMIMGSVFSMLIGKTVNTEDCYYIKTPIFVFGLSGDASISKETGLLVQEVSNSEDGISIVNHEYEFNSVSQNDFVEPDITDFEEVRDIAKEQGIGM